MLVGSEISVPVEFETDKMIVRNLPVGTSVEGQCFLDILVHEVPFLGEIDSSHTVLDKMAYLAAAVLEGIDTGKDIHIILPVIEIEMGRRVIEREIV